MADDMYSRATALRNFLVNLIVHGLIITFCFYVAGLLNVFFLRGMDSLKIVLQRDLFTQFLLSKYELSKNWTALFSNLDKISLYYGFFIKITLCTLSPFLVYIGVIFKYRDVIFSWRPFKQQENQHGNAHWATEREVKKMGLRSKKGMLLGVYKGKYLIEYSFQHALLFAPTGSGKGVGFVIPNLLFWDESVIVHDVKAENYEKTSGYRFQVLKQKVFVWNPSDQDGITHCYNPMDWVSKDAGGLVDDVQKITKFLLPKQEFWENEARAFTQGIMLYLYADDSKPKSLGQVLREMKSDDVAYNLAVILDTMGNKMHPVAYMNIAAFLQKAEKERSGVCSTATSALELWSNPFVDTATSKSHFNLRKFRITPHSLYVCISPNNIERLKPLLQIFYQQCTSIYTAKLPDPKIEKLGVMMLLDEFPTLGKMEEIRMGIAFYRGYKVKLFLIVQDTEQLKATYEASGMNSFLANSTYRITFAANNNDTAKLISDLLGNKTIYNENYSRPKYLDLNPSSRNVSVSKQSRALLLPQEVIGLPRDEEIILIESRAPIKCKKIFYYKDSFFTKKLLPKSVVPKQEQNIVSTSKKKADDNK